MEVQYLPGVGPKRASLLRTELEVSTVGDLLHTYPFRYIDRSSVTQIADVRGGNAYIQILAQVVSSELTGKGAKQRLSVLVRDLSGEMELVFFKGIKYTYDRLKPGSIFLFFGKPGVYNGKMNMVHPEIDNPPTEGAQNFSGTLTGVYPSTDKLRNGGVTGKVMNKLMAEAIDLAIGDVEETLPEYILKEKGLVPLKYAVRNIHFPSDPTAL
ncbi:MAG: ATP-dependent DNA helicase RecG, partial [Bacteroidales bacterium]|nr:ATP-dependent DNA helicase RecG [Bacteroidales bacterium]